VVELIATGGTPARDFGIAIRTHRNSWNILLLDSDAPDDGQLSKALVARHGWDKSHEESIFWMVEMMESWFHADKDVLQKYYGGDFKVGALKANPNVEQISKQDLEDGLKAATRNTQKGKYHKTRHAPYLLESIDPSRVKRAAPNCKKLFDAVLAKLA